MAITVDFGSCTECGEKNSTAATKCRACGVTLPWVKLPHQQAASQSQFAPQSSTAKEKFPFDWSPVLQIAGGLIFCLGVFLWCGNKFGFYPTFPGLGYIAGVIGAVIWRIGD